MFLSFGVSLLFNKPLLEVINSQLIFITKALFQDLLPCFPLLFISYYLKIDDLNPQAKGWNPSSRTFLK